MIQVREQVPRTSEFRMGGMALSGIAPEEYFTYDSVTTGGHNTARGCNGTAAYSVFRPSRPETFTSPGPAVYYFDNMNNRLATPEVRLQPRIAAADGANTSFFVRRFDLGRRYETGTSPERAQPRHTRRELRR